MRAVMEGCNSFETRFSRRCQNLDLSLLTELIEAIQALERMDSIRIKLEFDAELDLPKCWFLVVPSQHRSVAALSKALQTAFKIPTEIRLEMDDFYLLPSSACLGLLQSNDLIHVSSAAPLDVISRSGTAKRSLVDDLPASGTTASEHKVIGKKIKLDSSAYDIQSVSLQSKLAPESVDTASNGECSSGSSTSSSSDEEQEEAPIGKWTDIRERKSDIESSSGSDSSSSSEESSGDSESGAASDEDTETLVNSKKVPQMPKEPISTAKEEPLMNPPLSLIGKNKKKLLPKMLNHERVHQRFEPESPQAPEVVEPIQENRLEYLAPSADQVCV